MRCPGFEQGYVHVQGIQQTLMTQGINLWEPLGAFGSLWEPLGLNILWWLTYQSQKQTKRRAYWGTPKTPVRMIQSLRSSILSKAQLCLAKLDQLRQAARTGVEVRVKKECVELGTKVELHVRQAETNRMRILKWNCTNGNRPARLGHHPDRMRILKWNCTNGNRPARLGHHPDG
ncbi:putative T-complex 11 protein [Helianthus annuus]|nr:hypothetical protein HanHA300_Chr04g0138381 [Helianthus annuus]KAJ0597162.1 hypothetical protein HanHA89_Chr04g0151341 [Helianthus annuus]KAJ0757843.1 hypothetical protein HanLR1_Chr04g0143431 [Helianthus annuus]KAJ0761512.1 hypothetical protein HanOQP8_Chr04g0150691 [Helianthus annuus]KAJ0927038.1 putative T-complex 11 protein [Helianthus annuus]